MIRPLYESEKKKGKPPWRGLAAAVWAVALVLWAAAPSRAIEVADVPPGVLSTPTCLPRTAVNTDYFEGARPDNISDTNVNYGPNNRAFSDDGCDPSRGPCTRPWAHNMQGVGSPPRIVDIAPPRINPVTYELYEVKAFVTTPRGAAGAGDDGNPAVDAFGATSTQHTYFVTLYYTTTYGATWNRVNMDHFANMDMQVDPRTPRVYRAGGPLAGVAWSAPDVEFQGQAYDSADPATWGVMAPYDPVVGDGPVAPLLLIEEPWLVNPGNIGNAGVFQYRDRPTEYPRTPGHHSRRFEFNNPGLNAGFFDAGLFRSPQPNAPFGGGDPNDQAAYPNVAGWPVVRINGVPQINCNLYGESNPEGRWHPACGGPGSVPIGQVGYTLAANGQILFRHVLEYGAKVTATAYIGNRSAWTGYIADPSVLTTPTAGFSYHIMVTDTCGNIASGSRSNPITPDLNSPIEVENQGPWISVKDHDNDRRNIGEDPFIISAAGVGTTCCFVGEVGCSPSSLVACGSIFGCEPDPINICGGEGYPTHKDSLELTDLYVTHSGTITSGQLLVRIRAKEEMDFGCLGSWYPAVLVDGQVCQKDAPDFMWPLLGGFWQTADPIKLKAYALSISVDNPSGGGGTRLLLSIVDVPLDFLHGVIEGMAADLIPLPGVEVNASGGALNVWLDIVGMLESLGSGRDGLASYSGQTLCEGMCDIPCPLDDCTRDCDGDGWYNCCGVNEPGGPVIWKRYIGAGGTYSFEEANCPDEAPEEKECQVLPCPEQCDITACGDDDWAWYYYHGTPQYRYADCDGDLWPNCCPPGFDSASFPVDNTFPGLCDLPGPCCGTGAPPEYEADCIVGLHGGDCLDWDFYKWCWVQGCPDQCTEPAPDGHEPGYDPADYTNAPCPPHEDPPPGEPLGGLEARQGPDGDYWTWSFHNRELLGITADGSVDVKALTLQLADFDSFLCSLCLQTFNFSFFAHDETPTIRYTPGPGRGFNVGASRRYVVMQADTTPPARAEDLVACRGLPTALPDPYAPWADNAELGGCVYSRDQYVNNMLADNVQSVVIDVRFTEPVFNDDVARTPLRDLGGYRIYRATRHSGPFELAGEMSLASGSGYFACGSGVTPPNNDGSLQQCSGYPNSLFICGIAGCPAIIPGSDYVRPGVGWRYGVPGEFIHCFDKGDGNCSPAGEGTMMPDGQMYFYRMTSFDATPNRNESLVSNVAKVQIWRNDVPPTTPTLVSAIPMSNHDTIRVSWAANDKDPDMCDIDLMGTPNDESDDINRDCVDRPGKFSVGGYYLYRCIGPEDDEGYPDCSQRMRLISDKSAPESERWWRPIPFYKNTYVDDNRFYDHLDEGDGKLDRDAKYRYVLRTVDLRFQGDSGTPNPNDPDIFPAMCGHKYDALTGEGGIDNDGDGLVDEDPIDGVDNDGDGLIDEDPMDFVRCDLKPDPLDYECHEPPDPALDGANYEFCFFRDYLEFNYGIDDSESGNLRVHTLKPGAGNMSGFSNAVESRPVDTEPPGIPTGLNVLNDPDASGTALLIRWNPFNITNDPSFNHFVLYRAASTCGFDADGDGRFDPACQDDPSLCIDEDPFDNVDNDGDGLIDEDGCLPNDPKFGPYFPIREFTDACTADFPANWADCPSYQHCNKDDNGACIMLSDPMGSDQVTEFFDAGLARNREYFYRIAGVDFTGNEGALSYPPMGRMPVDEERPSTPHDLIVSNNPVGRALNLAWKIAHDGSDSPIFESDLAGYYVYRAPAGAAFTRINANIIPGCTADGTAEGDPCSCDTVGQGGAVCAFRINLTYADSDLFDSQLYWYRIRAVDMAGNLSDNTSDICEPDGRLTCRQPRDEIPPSPPVWTWTHQGITYGTAQPKSPRPEGGSLVLRFVPNDVRFKANGTWETSPTEYDLAGYFVEMSEDGATWTRLNEELLTQNNDVDDYSTYPNMEIGYLATELTNNVTYQFRIVAVDDAGAENSPGCSPHASPGNESCSVVIQGTPGKSLPPAAPTGVSATPLGGATVGVGWRPNTESDIAGYKAYYSETGAAGTFTRAVAPEDPGTLCGDSNTVAHDGQLGYIIDSSIDLVPGHRRYYVVTAFDTSCNESDYSAIVSARISEQDTTPPAAPSGLFAVGAMGWYSTDYGNYRVLEGGLALIWDGNTEPDLEDYRVYKGLTQFGAYEFVASKACFERECAYIFPRDSFEPGSDNWFIVTAVDESGNESLSPCIDYYTEAVCNTDSFCAWDPANAQCNGATPNNYLNPYLAVYGSPEGTEDETPPEHPLSTRVDPMPYGRALKFVWQPMDTTAEPNVDLAGYKVYRDTTMYPGDSGDRNMFKNLVADIPLDKMRYQNYEPVADSSCTMDADCSGLGNDGFYCDIAAGQCMKGQAYYIDDEVLNGIRYFYVITAYDINGNECYQDPELAQYRPRSGTPADTAPPLPPAGLSVTPMANNPNGLAVTWSAAPSLNEMVSLGMTDTDGDGVPDIIEDLYGDVGYKDDPQLRPTLPGRLSDDYSFVGFQLNRGRTVLGPWVTIDADPHTPGNTLFDDTAYYDTALQSGEQYCYMVTSVDAEGQKSNAFVDIITCGKPGIDNIPPAIPTGLTALGRNTRVNLSWSPNSEPDLAGYKIYRCVGGPSLCGQQVANAAYALLVTTTATAYTDSGLQNEVTYWYRVTAFDNATDVFGEVCRVRGKDNQPCPNESGYSDAHNAVPRASAGAGLVIPVSRGWNLLAFPPEGARASRVGDRKSSVMRFHAGNYTDINDLPDAGLGVWYFSHETGSLIVEDMGDRESLTMGLVRGWNQSGNPFMAAFVWDNDHVKVKVPGGASLNLSQAVNAGHILEVFVYDPVRGYVEVNRGDIIPMGKGMWIKTANNLTIEFSK